ncbi:MAG: hypothetical protein ACOX1P_18335 [Thermoguttaceae bacterium]
MESAAACGSNGSCRRAISENDNAAIMSLYNVIDGYAARLNTAWVNVHHASKGDQSGKGTTDVGSGAGAQSRAADTHLSDPAA